MAEQRIQRKLAAILAADVAGYSRMMEADEAGTLAHLKSVRTEVIDPRIAADGGRVVKTMGDGVLVEFPSAVDAVEDALAIQQAMAEHNAALPEIRRLEFRIGINVGDVIIDGDDIHGEGVNVAARLEALCEPGTVYVSGAIRDQAEGKLDARFDDLGEHTVKNISRPVSVFRVGRVRSRNAETKDDGPSVSPTDKPSIIVLPFDNMSADPEQVHFADGITEDIITALAHLSRLSVLARNTSFAFKGRTVDVKEIGRELGVHYALEGSVRRAGERIRITAQLIDTAGGHHLWAERYDRDLTDVFAVQDEITANVVSALQVELVYGEQARRWRADTRNVDAWLEFLQARSHFYQMAPSAHARARRHLERAVELDPDYAVALASLAWLDAIAADLAEPDARQAAIDRATELVRKAEAIDPTIAILHIAKGAIYRTNGEHEAAIAAGRRAVELEGSAEAYAMLARFLKDAGRADEAFRAVTRAIRLAPMTPPPFLWFLGDIYRLTGRREDAVRTFSQLREAVPEAWHGPLFLAVLHGEGGDWDAARAQVETLLEIAPEFTVRRFTGFASYSDPAITERMVDILRKAGLPE